MKNYLNKSLLIIIFLSLIKIYLGQSNNYFSDNESWSGQTWITDKYDSFYVKQQGDTIINNDSLIKLFKADDYNGIDTTYYLAKNDSGILYMYISESSYTNINDTIIIDYSRTDSISYWASMYNEYEARKITGIDTLFFNGKPKKILYINDSCGASNDDYVLEGTFNIVNKPFFDFCFEYANLLTCYSLNDSSYYVSSDNFTYYQNGTCFIYNLDIKEVDKKQSHIYPNPFVSHINIQIDNFKEYLVASIYSLNGIVIRKTLIDNKTFYLDLTELSPGVYYLYLSNSDFNEYHKIIKL